MVESEAGTEVEKLLSAAFSSVRELLRDGRLLSMGFFLFLFLSLSRWTDPIFRAVLLLAPPLLPFTAALPLLELLLLLFPVTPKPLGMNMTSPVAICRQMLLTVIVSK